MVDNNDSDNITGNESTNSSTSIKAQAPRARNRTVVLSADIAGKMRSQLAGPNTDNPESGFVDISKVTAGLPETEPAEKVPPILRNTGNTNPPSASENTPPTNRKFDPLFSEEDNMRSSQSDNSKSVYDSLISDPETLNSGNSKPFIQPPTSLREETTQQSLYNQTQEPSRQESYNERPLEQPLNNPINQVNEYNTPPSKVKSFVGAGEPEVPQTQIVEQPSSTMFEPLHNSTTTAPKKVSKTLLCGFLVSFDNDPMGNSFELREGRTIISSDLPSGGGNVVLVNDPSVGSMHAVIKIQEGSIILLDQLSDTGTFVISSDGVEEKRLSGDMVNLNDGDLIRFGNCKFSYRSVK